MKTRCFLVNYVNLVVFGQPGLQRGVSLGACFIAKCAKIHQFWHIFINFDTFWHRFWPCFCTCLAVFGRVWPCYPLW